MNKIIQEKTDCSEAKWFLWIAVIIGLILCCIVPPMSTPDEGKHFINAYSVSCGNFMPDLNYHEPGYALPKGIIDFASQDPLETDVASVIRNSYTEAEEDVQFFSDYYSIEPCTNYYISAFGMLLQRMIDSIASDGNSAAFPNNLLLAGRFFSLAYYIIAFYLAIRLSPCFKKTMLLLGTMPMSIYLGASINPDGVLISSTVLLFALFLYIMQPDTKVSGKYIAGVLIVSFFVAGIKCVYSALFLVLLAIPAEKFGGMKKKLWCAAAVAAVAILSFFQVFWTLRIKKIIIPAEIESQKRYVLQHLGAIPSLILSTAKSEAIFYGRSFIGILGHLDKPFPMPVYELFGFILLIVSLYDLCSCERVFKREWHRILPALATLIASVAVFLNEYITWTPLKNVADTVGGRFVEGVQGRYFLELYLPFLLVFSNSYLLKKKKINLERVFNDLSKIFAAVMGISTVLILYVFRNH